MRAIERQWGLDADTLEGQGFDAESIRLHASVELDEDRRRIEELLAAGEIGADEARELGRECEERNRSHWREYSLA